MIVFHHQASFDLEAQFDAADLSDALQTAIHRSGVKEGVAVLFTEGSTSAVTTIEYESGCLRDLREALDRIAPTSADYHHNRRWGDGNGYSHLRAALLKPSLEVPVMQGAAAFSTWQQPIVINLDNRDRRRTVRFTIMGVGE